MPPHPPRFLSSRALNYLAERIRGHRRQRRSGGGALSPAGRRCCSGPSAQRRHLHPTRGRLRDRRRHRLALRPEGDSPAQLGGRRPDTDATHPAAGVRGLGRHADPDRPGRRSVALLQRQAQTPRRERAGHRRRCRPARVGITGITRLGTRPHRRSHPRHNRRPDQRGLDDLRRQGLSGRPGQRAYAVQTTRFRPKLSRRQKAVNPDPREDPRQRRTSHRHTQPGRSWSSCAAAHAEPPRSSKPSSSCTTSKPTATQDEDGSMCARVKIQQALT